MLKQRRSTKASRGRQATQACATFGRPSTRRNQRDSPGARLPAEKTTPSTETRPLTTDDISAIVQQVAAAISSENHPPPPPAPATTSTTTASHTSGPEEESSNPPPAVLTQSDIPSLVNAVVSRLSSTQAGSSTGRPGNL